MNASSSSQRRLVLGAIAWTLAVQFFVAQAVVQSSWTTPFSLTHNYISDLGNTSCGWFDVGSPVYVCSPWHAWMNASFILLGVLILAGSALVQTALAAGRPGVTGLLLISLAGPGEIAVGLYPEDVNLTIHGIGAGLHFIGGNLGLIVLGAVAVRTRRRTLLGRFTVASGAIGLLATVLFVRKVYLGLGIGGMERMAAYPLPLWLSVAGICLLREQWALRVADPVCPEDQEPGPSDDVTPGPRASQAPSCRDRHRAGPRRALW